MSIEEVKVAEVMAAEQSQRVLDLIEGGRRQELHEFVDGLDRTDLAWLVLSLAAGLLGQESANGRLHVQNGILKRQNEVLDTANKNLFGEKRELHDRNKELRDILNKHAASAPLRKGKKAA